MITTINKQQLLNLKEQLNNAISIVERQKETPKFLLPLSIMKKNIVICIENDYDGIEELVRYLSEDWALACKCDNGLGTWYIMSDNIDIKASQNRKFEEAILEIDKILQANYIIPRTWYDSNALHNIGISFNKYKSHWDNTITDITKRYGFAKSKIQMIPDDIWTYAKYISIAPDDNSLIKWFETDIPAFGYIAPLEIAKLINGDNILRSFMMSINA